MSPAEVLSEAARLGLIVRADEGRIVVRPARLLPPALADEIRGRRDEVLAFLEALPRESVHGAAPASADPGRLVCFSCGSTDFWRGVGLVVCRRCHPPAPGAEVLTLSRTGSDASRPVEIEAGSSAPTPETRTHGVRGGTA